ncbi:MAG TPA: acyl-CoA dehydrogenase family protein [Acidimicrobiales bacterium]|nr:acyl-CoA dehydrogenase family protein [Acidimicrobiales bacterium]
MFEIRVDEPEEWGLIRTSVRGLLARHAPTEVVRAWDDKGEYPDGFFRRLAEGGFFAMPFRSELGGADAGPEEMVVVAEELGRAGMDIAAGFGVTVFLGLTIQDHGTDDQRQRFLPALLSGERRMSVSMTEPEAGSDAAAIRTSARPVDGGYVLNGQKVFTTGGGLPNTTLVVTAKATTDGEERDRVSVFLVPADAPGVTVRKLDTIGRHILGTYEVFYDDVFVPAHDLLGPPGQGWRVLKQGLVMERLFTCGAYVGSMWAVLDMAVSYVNDRRQFGQPIGRFQAVSHPLADMWADAQAGRMLAYSAARRVAQGVDARIDVSAAKLFITEAYQRATSHGMQVMGGYGFMSEYDMHRYWKDARIATISAGTSQIQREIICRELALR